MSRSLFEGWVVGFFALVLWREARGEDHQTKVAVACSIRDRVRHPKWWGTTYYSVLKKKWQYSSVTDPKDRQLTAWPEETDAVFEECLRIAGDVMDDKLPHPLKGADSYYDLSIPPPAWATEEKKVGQLGRLIFYNIDGETED